MEVFDLLKYSYVNLGLSGIMLLTCGFICRRVYLDMKSDKRSLISALDACNAKHEAQRVKSEETVTKLAVVTEQNTAAMRDNSASNRELSESVRGMKDVLREFNRR